MQLLPRSTFLVAPFQGIGPSLWKEYCPISQKPQLLSSSYLEHVHFGSAGLWRKARRRRIRLGRTVSKSFMSLLSILRSLHLVHCFVCFFSFSYYVFFLLYSYIFLLFLHIALLYLKKFEQLSKHGDPTVQMSKQPATIGTSLRRVLTIDFQKKNQTRHKFI